MWMNDYEIDERAAQYAEHPVLGPATITLTNLMRWTNRNSDGWGYWQKPGRAASRLMDLIMGAGLDPYVARFGERDDATPEALAAALRPVKAFRTRQGADFEIVTELPPPPDPERVLWQQAGEHIEQVCKAAGLAVMVQIYTIVQDREQVPSARLLALTPEDVTEHYERAVGPAVDAIEGLLA